MMKDNETKENERTWHSVWYTVGMKLKYLGHLMLRADSLEKTLMLGKTEGRRKGG